MNAKIPKPTIIEEKRARMGQVRRKSAQEISNDLIQTQKEATKQLKPIVE